MKTLIIAAASAATVAAFAPAVASAQVSNVTGYGSVGYSHHDLEGADVGAIQGRLGARFGQYVGVEGEIGLGVLKDNLSVGGVDGEAKMNYSAAAYAVGFLPVGEKADLYVSGESWNYGAGGQYLFDGKNGVRADYTRHDFTDGGGKADVYSVGYVHKF
ncbi:MAG: porin family protein [Caulobacteraceae bacterium]|nr:MAG: porin family protein [Caulobacteraceae bacterium]